QPHWPGVSEVSEVCEVHPTRQLARLPSALELPGADLPTTTEHDCALGLAPSGTRPRTSGRDLVPSFAGRTRRDGKALVAQRTPGRCLRRMCVGQGITARSDATSRVRTGDEPLGTLFPGRSTISPAPSPFPHRGMHKQRSINLWSARGPKDLGRGDFRRIPTRPIIFFRGGL